MVRLSSPSAGTGGIDPQKRPFFLHFFEALRETGYPSTHALEKSQSC
jgi:hypothetical protein